MSQAQQEQLLKNNAYEDNLAFLKASGLYDHLTQVLLSITSSAAASSKSPADVLASFEHISTAIKNNQVQLPISSESKVLDEARDKLQKLLAPTLNAVQGLLRQAVPVPDQSKDDLKVIPDITSEANLLQHAGVNLGAENVYTLLISLRNLARDKNLSSDIRFFGKILGTSRDYYVIEAKQDASEDAELAPGQDAAGSGTNTYAYFVSNSVLGPWEKLPETHPSHIASSRHIRKLFSGNLNQPLNSYPPLVSLPARAAQPPASGSSSEENSEESAANSAQLVDDLAKIKHFNTERYYLRAVLSRLAAATSVSPAGAFEKKDDDDSMAKVENPAPFDASEYTDLSKWIHTRQYIYPSGKTISPEAEAGDDSAAGIAQYRALSEDTFESVLPAESKGWAVRLSANVSLDLHPAVIVKSLLWPGAVSVCKGNAYASFYLGNGLQVAASSKDSWLSVPPPAIQSEYSADAEYKYEPKEDGADADAESGASKVAPRPPLVFQQDLSHDPNPPKPVAASDEQDFDASNE